MHKELIPEQSTDKSLETRNFPTGYRQSQTQQHLTENFQQETPNYYRSSLSPETFQGYLDLLQINTQHVKETIHELMHGYRKGNETMVKAKIDVLSDYLKQILLHLWKELKLIDETDYINAYKKISKVVVVREDTFISSKKEGQKVSSLRSRDLSIEEILTIVHRHKTDSLYYLFLQILV